MKKNPPNNRKERVSKIEFDKSWTKFYIITKKLLQNQRRTKCANSWAFLIFFFGIKGTQVSSTGPNKPKLCSSTAAKSLSHQSLRTHSIPKLAPFPSNPNPNNIKGHGYKLCFLTRAARTRCCIIICDIETSDADGSHQRRRRRATMVRVRSEWKGKRGKMNKKKKRNPMWSCSY